MKYDFIAIGLSILTLQSCTDNLILHTDHEAIIIGNACRGTSTESSSAFTFGSQVLLNASGCLQANNIILTYTDGQWEAEKTLNWNGNEDSTQITVLHPVYPNLAYTKEDLYRNGTLEDVLYVRKKYPAESPINLNFKHLFSRLNLRLNGELQDKFQRIEITYPFVVSKIDPIANITFDSQTPHTDFIAQTSPSGNYSFIIPPTENMSISIKIQAADKTYTTQLEPRIFASNKEYTYNIRVSEKPAEKTPGITTAEEWIAFSKLINSNTLTSYKGKTLEDFGETINGVTTYYLLNDIDFTGVDCTDLKQIGQTRTDYYFSDTFDGQGHTLYHIPILTEYGGSGVFGAISQTGIVRNLYVESSNISITSNSGSGSQGIGILAGRNRGKIQNCSVKDCKITSEATKSNQFAPTGGIAGASTGEITNCYSENISIQCSNKPINENPAGGIVGSNEGGMIINCYSTNNTIKNKESYNGGICGKASGTAHIDNCYVYNIDVIATKGLLAGWAENSHFLHNCYYSISNIPLIGKNTVNQLSGNILYTSSFEDSNGTPVYQLLNQWIDHTAPTLYPEMTFTQWKDGGAKYPATFVTEIP